MNHSFYNSKAWRRLSKAFLSSKSYICERCGGPAELAHHRVYLTAGNVWDANISMNPELLEALCQNCHNTEHFGSGGAVAEGLTFDENGELIKG
jgi:5-methylcytosine-specific restriction endonuclease McrA